jgi:hypothetical protein
VQIATAAEGFKKFSYPGVYGAILVLKAFVVDAQEFLHTIFDNFLECIRSAAGLVTWSGSKCAGGHLGAKCRQSPSASLISRGRMEERNNNGVTNKRVKP